ncbi:MAG: 5,10-methylenetetrahydrofolate reductase [Acidimicrobiales bacterium]|nr:MAG: 5,10-methylenetetrahydrofolate reductase [Acidimicrobiales bacterium]
MMIRDMLARGKTFSFEFFPPKTEEARRLLEQTLRELEPLRPSFVSVTYGAGGSTRKTTRELVLHIHRDTSMVAMAHLTCVSHTRAELEEIVRDYGKNGVVNILALGGDPPKDGGPPGELEHAIQLVELIRGVGDFSVGVAAHPEVHPRSPDRESDRRHLAEKLALADFAITQFFFESVHYVRLMEELRELGCDKPVIPGIMPVTNVASVARMAEMSGATFPTEFLERLHAAERDGGPEAVRKVGVDQASSLCEELLELGVPGLHFYTLNRSTATREIYERLSLRPGPAAAPTPA